MHVRLAFEGGASARLRRALAIAAIPTLLFSVACRPVRTSHDALQCRFSPEHPRIGVAKAEVTVVDRTGQPVSVGKVSLEADMNHPGMHPVFAEAKPSASGTYEGALALDMAGDWTVTVRAQLRNGAMIEKEFPFTVTDK